MPRAFIPCLYHEWATAHPRTGESIVGCDVIELHQFCVLTTRAEEVVMGPNSHQFTLRDMEHVVPIDEIPARLRAPLFAQFYAAMADLE